MKLLIRLALMVGVVWVTFALLPGLEYDGEWWTLVIIALLLALANTIVIPLLKLISLPIRIVTLGLFTLAINVLVIVGVIILAANSDIGVTSDGFGTNLLAALLLTVLSSAVSFFVRD